MGLVANPRSAQPRAARCDGGVPGRASRARHQASLTLGAAVDANILINERIRESGRGRSVHRGWPRATTAPHDDRDANATDHHAIFPIASGLDPRLRSR
jgi:hypothetical protein